MFTKNVKVMKKLFVIPALAALLFACNNPAKTEEPVAYEEAVEVVEEVVEEVAPVAKPAAKTTTPAAKPAEPAPAPVETVETVAPGAVVEVEAGAKLEREEGTNTRRRR